MILCDVYSCPEAFFATSVWEGLTPGYSKTDTQHMIFPELKPWRNWKMEVKSWYCVCVCWNKYINYNDVFIQNLIFTEFVFEIVMDCCNKPVNLGLHAN